MMMACIGVKIFNATIVRYIRVVKLTISFNADKLYVRFCF